jgi:hypothetical protein
MWPHVRASACACNLGPQDKRCTKANLLRRRYVAAGLFRSTDSGRSLPECFRIFQRSMCGQHRTPAASQAPGHRLGRIRRVYARRHVAGTGRCATDLARAADRALVDRYARRPPSTIERVCGARGARPAPAGRRARAPTFCRAHAGPKGSTAHSRTSTPAGALAHGALAADPLDVWALYGPGAAHSELTRSRSFDQLRAGAPSRSDLRCGNTNWGSPCVQSLQNARCGSVACRDRTARLGHGGASPSR